MSHLSKIAFSTESSQLKDSWETDINNVFRDQIISRTLWGSKQPDKNMIEGLRAGLTNAYSAGIRYYHNLTKNDQNQNLVPGLKLIPIEEVYSNGCVRLHAGRVLTSVMVRV